MLMQRFIQISKKHDKTYPTPKYLKSVTKIGNIGYEGEMDNSTDGSNLIKKHC